MQYKGFKQQTQKHVLDAEIKRKKQEQEEYEKFLEIDAIGDEQFDAERDEGKSQKEIDAYKSLGMEEYI